MHAEITRGTVVQTNFHVKCVKKINSFQLQNKRHCEKFRGLGPRENELFSCWKCNPSQGITTPKQDAHGIVVCLKCILPVNANNLNIRFNTLRLVLEFLNCLDVCTIFSKCTGIGDCRNIWLTTVINKRLSFVLFSVKVESGNKKM